MCSAVCVWGWMQYAFILPWPLLSVTIAFVTFVYSIVGMGRRNPEGQGICKPAFVHRGLLEWSCFLVGRNNAIPGQGNKICLEYSINRQTAVQLTPGIPLTGLESPIGIRNMSKEACHLLASGCFCSFLFSLHGKQLEMLKRKRVL